MQQWPRQANYGLGGQKGSLVIDLSGLDSITVDGDTAIVGAGNRLGDVAEALYNNGQKAIPHGTCPWVYGRAYSRAKGKGI